MPSPFLIRRFFLAGRRLWVLVDPAIPVQIRSVACDGGATFSTPGNSTVAFLSALFLMSRRHRVIGHWFESNLLHIWGSSSVGRAIPVSLLVHLFFIASRNATIQTQPSTQEGRMANHDQYWEESKFEITSKRRKGFPSETRVKRGVRVVHGNKELSEKLGRNDLCPCGSGRRF